MTGKGRRATIASVLTAAAAMLGTISTATTAMAAARTSMIVAPNSPVAAHIEWGKCRQRR